VVRVADRSTTVTKLTRAEMIELLQVRAHLEELAFRLAVKHLDDASIRELRDCLAKLEKKIEDSKQLYAERDEITLYLVGLGFAAAQIEKLEFKLVDNFSDKNVCYRAAFVRRWEVKIKEAK